MKYLIDTNVISEVRKGTKCNEAVAEWWSSIAETEIFFSVLTIGEIRKGIESIRRRDPRSAEALHAWLSRLMTDYAAAILPVDAEIAEEWGRLNVPDPLPVIDGLLAATAKLHDLTVVTRNVLDIASTGVAVLNPWTSRAPS